MLYTFRPAGIKTQLHFIKMIEGQRHKNTFKISFSFTRKLYLNST